MPKATYLIISLVSKKWPVSLNLCQKIDFKRYLKEKVLGNILPI